MLKKLLQIRIWKRIYLERLGEPIIYNIVSIFIFLFGDYRSKIKYDLVPRQPYAFGVDEAFRIGSLEGVSKIVLVEFGVASGAGLFNLQRIASKLSQIYGIDYEVIGFDTGEGMPEPVDYRDHPEKYHHGDFPPLSLDINDLPEKTRVFYGDVGETIVHLSNILSNSTRLGFISIDVDYYSSTVKALNVCHIAQNNLISRVVMYLDDVNNIDHNPYCGELLAVNEFNEAQTLRKISKMTQLGNWRFFKNALWIDQMYFLHVFDSSYRTPENTARDEVVHLYNPYL